MTLQSWYATLAQSNPDLFRLIHDFNTRPQHWVPPQRLSALPNANVVGYLSKAGHSRALLGKWVFNQLGVDPDKASWEFTEPRSRLALLSWEALEALARFSGAALRWSEIKSIIGKEDIQRLKARLGGDAHLFALQRGPFLRSAANLKTLGKNAPPLPDQAWLDGWGMVAKALAGEPLPTIERFLLKVPKEFRDVYSDNLPVEVRDGAWGFIRRVAQEVLPELELRCFA